MLGFWERFGAIVKNVAYINPPMAEQLGNSFYTLIQKQDVPIWPWTLQIPTSYTLLCGNSEEQAGLLSPVATKVRSTNLRMEEKHGTKSTMASQQENWADWPLQWHLQTPTCFTRSSRQKRTSAKACTAVMMPVPLGNS